MNKQEFIKNWGFEEDKSYGDPKSAKAFEKDLNSLIKEAQVDPQEYLQRWEKEHNPFYPNEMKWDRRQVNRFLKDYKQQEK